MTKQKFKRGTRVRIIDADVRRELRIVNSDMVLERPSHRQNYGGDEGVVVGSYHQQFGCGQRDKYTLVTLDASGKPSNMVSWFEEAQLEQVSDDCVAGHALIDAFTERRA